MKKLIPFLFTALLLFSCQDEVNTTYEDRKEPLGKPLDSKEPAIVMPEPADSTEKAPTYEVVAVEVATGAYGYNILQDGKVFIKQDVVPSLQGNKHFSTEEDAIKVGEFVANKLRNGIMPPTISPEDIESLGVVIK